MNRINKYLAPLLALAAASAPCLAASPQNLADLKSAAEAGAPQAQLTYGKALKNRDEARVWVQKSADQGLGEAWYWLGYAGLGKEPSLTYYEKSAEKGYAPAFSTLLDDLLFRAGSAADTSKAKKYADLARELKIDIGYDSAKKFQTIDRCYQAGSPTLPASDQPTTEEKTAFKSSKGDCLLLQPKDLVQYRKCLLSQESADNNSLAEIYANGWGVQRNVKLALALVCHGSDVEAELEGMVDTLSQEKRPAKTFTYCAHVTSGMNAGVCAARAEAIAAAKRSSHLDTLTAHWNLEQKQAFQILNKMADRFFSSHATLEQDMSGTLRGQMAISSEAEQKADLVNSIETFEVGQFPTDSDFAQSDKILNNNYSKIMSSRFSGTVTAAGIKSTQRNWIKYRDAWVKFAHLKYPNISAATWKTWLSRKRAEQLRTLNP